MKNITIRNSALPKNVYNYYKSYIYETISELYSAVGRDFVLRVSIVNDDVNENVLDSAMACVYCENNCVRLKIAASNVTNIEERDGYYLFESSLYHEFAHIYDILNYRDIYKNNSFDKDIGTFKDFIIDIGFKCWTEYYAYFMTFKYYPRLSSITFLNLVKRFSIIKKEFSNISEIKYGKIDKEQKGLIENLITKIKNFNYFCSFYLGTKHAGRIRAYNYSSQISQSEDFQFVRKLINSLEKSVFDISKNVYCADMSKKFFNLGNKILSKVFNQFDIDLVKLSNGKIKYVWYSKE